MRGSSWCFIVSPRLGYRSTCTTVIVDGGRGGGRVVLVLFAYMLVLDVSSIGLAEAERDKAL